METIIVILFFVLALVMAVFGFYLGSFFSQGTLWSARGFFSPNDLFMVEKEVTSFEDCHNRESIYLIKKIKKINKKGEIVFKRPRYVTFSDYKPGEVQIWHQGRTEPLQTFCEGFIYKFSGTDKKFKWSNFSAEEIFPKVNNYRVDIGIAVLKGIR
ncbi:MAG: hypothetical protein PHC89_02710 [Candidatus Pacebacteria bacterium]|nr:hypothetical protein [Candidatus Paceibacterota bacterium]